MGVEEREDRDRASREDLPQWVHGLSCSVWVCDRRGRIVFANARARELLDGGIAVEGSACHRCVQGLATSGAEHCASDCAWLASAREGATPDPALIRVLGRTPRARWVLVFPILLEQGSHEERRLVHCAHDLDSFVRAAEYLERVAHRSGAHEGVRGATRERLTGREREILQLLGRDEDPFSIARLLHLSPVTVRNHVQHILQKLSAHTVQEAVALYVLGNGVGRGPR